MVVLEDPALVLEGGADASAPTPAEWCLTAAACAAADLPLDGVPDGALAAAWCPLGIGATRRLALGQAAL